MECRYLECQILSSSQMITIDFTLEKFEQFLVKWIIDSVIWFNLSYLPGY